MEIFRSPSISSWRQRADYESSRGWHVPKCALFQDMGLKEWEAYFWYLLSTLQTCQSKCALVYGIAVDLKCLYECIGFNLQPINWIRFSSRSRLCSHGKFVRDASCLMSQSSLVVKQRVGWDLRLTIEWHFNRFVTIQQSTVVNFQLAPHWVAIWGIVWQLCLSDFILFRFHLRSRKCRGSDSSHQAAWRIRKWGKNYWAQQNDSVNGNRKARVRKLTLSSSGKPKSGEVTPSLCLLSVDMNRMDFVKISVNDLQTTW